MKCPKCNYSLPADSAFCQYCGAPIEKPVVPPAMEATAAPIAAVEPPAPVAEFSAPEAPKQPAPIEAKLVSTAVAEEPKVPASGLSHHNKMILCPKCGHTLPEDSVFCSFCGNHISAKPVAPVMVAPAAPASETVREAVNLEPNPLQSTPMKTPSQKKTRKQWKITAIILIVLVVISLAANIGQFVYHYRKTAEMQAQLEEANKTLADKDSSITYYENKVSSQTATIDKQKKEISNLKEKGNYFDEIVSQMRYGNAGYAASNFFASDSVIVVSEDDTNCKFTLTANWASGGTVEVDYSSKCAWVSFDNNEWYTSTKITVHPLYKGVTVATFSNNVNSQTFKVLIIVTD